MADQTKPLANSKEETDDAIRLTIRLTVFPDPVQWLVENIDDFCWDRVSSVYPIDIIVEGGGELKPTKFVDRDGETGEQIPIPKTIGQDEMVKALKLLTEQIGRTLFVGCIKNPFELTDPCNWDAEVVDAYWQLCYYGEVIYG